MIPASTSASFNSKSNYKSENFKSPFKTTDSFLSARLKRVSFEINEQIFKIPSANNSVVAYEHLEKGLRSNEYRAADLVTGCDLGRIGIRKSSNGTIRPVQNIPSWIRGIKLSPDVHSHNTFVELTEEKRIRLRVSKDIVADEELVMWFSEEVALLMDIPFLTPINIIDNKCYSCHLCNTSFESPNPLKIHLAVLCGQLSVDILWKRLHHGVASITTDMAKHHPYEAPREEAINYNFDRSSYLSPTFSFLPIAHIPQSQSTTDPSINAASQIETIVSNMGSTKQGHLCIYCGKVYSRKYGLKIHIRTHTGFKPLKCKFCTRPFGDPSNLNKHVRLHMQSGSGAFKCHLCHKTLLRRRDLKRHLETRHNESRFSTPPDAGSSSDDY